MERHSNTATCGARTAPPEPTMVMDLPATFSTLNNAIGAAAAHELPTLIGHLVAAEERARMRLREHLTPTHPTPVLSAPGSAAERLLTPEDAAQLASVPVARIYRWAKGARWATRPSRRCLRVQEHGFRRWLASRAGA